MAEILPIRRKTLSNQSIKKPVETSREEDRRTGGWNEKTSEDQYIYIYLNNRLMLR